ncbi:hypothetical protein FSP39_023099 [Pinctada imbricata]|uniref:Metallo-beta-lactamase domain-containing protein n=1 Tax=Pinctada imbricata TaxID=66713 RepID=A0AA88XJZ7_PINIB|nr:hypothetical protein FSP39_023099 [Pinctada imbricata]
MAPGRSLFTYSPSDPASVTTRGCIKANAPLASRTNDINNPKMNDQSEERKEKPRIRQLTMEGRAVASAVLGIALLAYVGSKIWGTTRGSLPSTYRERMLRHADAEKDLVEHPIQIHKPEVRKVTENIYMAIGYALANSIMLIGPDGIVIVDVTESYESGREVFAAFRNITKKPVKAIVYTHNHADHTYGARAFIEDPNNPPEIWAHIGILKEFKRTFSSITQAFMVRAMRQFGALLPDEITSGRGIGQKLQYGTSKNSIGVVYPNKYVQQQVTEFNAAGLNMSIVHIPGETDDQIGVWFPDDKAFLCADDIYRAFPNLYAIRGTPNRDLMQWARSIDVMLSFRPQYLVPSHTNPVIGEDNIRDILVPYRDAIQFVHDQTVRYINQGLSPEEIAEIIKLPKSLQGHPYLKEFYGTVGWSAKSVFNAYLGWFNGDAVSLNPLTAKARAERMVKLVGASKLVQTAKEAYASNDYQWALELSSQVLLVDNSNSEAREIKIDSLISLGSRQISRNGRNYYMTSAFEEAGTYYVKFWRRKEKEGNRNTTN